jgi:hypothetical protein
VKRRTIFVLTLILLFAAGAAFGKTLEEILKEKGMTDALETNNLSFAGRFLTG